MPEPMKPDPDALAATRSLVLVTLGVVAFISAKRSRFGAAHGSGAVFHATDLVESNFERANLVRPNFTAAKLQRADFAEATLERALLAGANLEGANLKGCNFAGSDLKEASFKGARYDRFTVAPEKFDYLAQGMIREE